MGLNHEGTRGGINRVLSDSLIDLNMDCRNKEAALQKMAELLYKEGKVANVAAFLEAINLREKKGMTGIGLGVAIPHGVSDTVIKSSLAVGRTDHDIVWETLDDHPVRMLIVFAIRSAEQDIVDLEILSQVSSALADEETLEKLLRTQDKQEIKTLLSQKIV